MSTTLKSIPATISPDGAVTLFEPIKLIAPASAMVTISGFLVFGIFGVTFLGSGDIGLLPK